MTPTTTDEAALLAAICDNPACDTVRLAFADWCDENGQGERAEFIRVQCELARMPPPHKKAGFHDNPNIIHPAGPDYWRFGMEPMDDLAVGDRVDIYNNGKRKGTKIERGLVVTRVVETVVTVKRDAESGPWKGEALAKRATYLLDWASIGLWFAWPGCPGVRAQFTDRELFEKYKCGPKSFAALFRRGFVDSVTCTLAEWLRFGPEIVRRQPVTRVRISDRSPTSVLPGGAAWWTFAAPTDAAYGQTIADILPAEFVVPMAQTAPGGHWTGAVVGWYTNAVRYATVDLAIAALSDACLAWAKRKDEVTT